MRVKVTAVRVKVGPWSIFKAFVKSSQASHPHCHKSQVAALRRAEARGEGGGLEGDDGERFGLEGEGFGFDGEGLKP